jgi:hypothetical protein
MDWMASRELSSDGESTILSIPAFHDGYLMLLVIEEPNLKSPAVRAVLPEEPFRRVRALTS